MKAIDIIHNEHRALASVLQALQFVLDNIRDGKSQPDLQLLAALVDYITQVPEKIHHPKEDDYLFALMRKRSSEAQALLDQLEHDHAQGARQIAALQTALIHYMSLGRPAFEQFDTLARSYVEFSWQHLNREEGELLPLARRDLLAEDWAEIDAAFAANFDPRAGVNGEYGHLFTHIVNHLPAPYGLGG